MKYFLTLLCLLLFTPAYAQDTPHEKLMILDPFIGTWKAEVGKDTFDVSRYEWVLGGKAVRITHSINDGDYGGEALLHWNTDKAAITYRYVTTASFYTEGTITPTDNGFDAHEMVYGNAGAASAENAMLSFPIPAGTQFLSATGGGMAPSQSLGVRAWKPKPDSAGAVKRWLVAGWRKSNICSMPAPIPAAEVIRPPTM